MVQVPFFQKILIRPIFAIQHHATLEKMVNFVFSVFVHDYLIKPDV